MTHLDDVLAQLNLANRPALIGYWMAGYPNLEISKQAVVTMVNAGVDIIEVGVPYSDPVMDGPTIQAAAQTALDTGFKVREVFEVVKAVHDAGAPVVVMSYWNVIEQYGIEKFVTDLIAAGGSGIITPDLTPDEARDWDAAAKKHNANQIFLVAPSSTNERLAMTANAASGFIYATAIMGVTGLRESTSNLAPVLVERIRKITDKPVGVGLGVSNAEQAKAVGEYADAVIVGSAFIHAMMSAPDENQGLVALDNVVREIRTGIESARSS